MSKKWEITSLNRERFDAEDLTLENLERRLELQRWFDDPIVICDDSWGGNGGGGCDTDGWGCAYYCGVDSCSTNICDLKCGTYNGQCPSFNCC